MAIGQLPRIEECGVETPMLDEESPKELNQYLGQARTYRGTLAVVNRPRINRNPIRLVRWNSYRSNPAG